MDKVLSALGSYYRNGFKGKARTNRFDYLVSLAYVGILSQIFYTILPHLPIKSATQLVQVGNNLYSFTDNSAMAQEKDVLYHFIVVMFGILVVLPFMAMTVRRFHDLNLSGGLVIPLIIVEIIVNAFFAFPLVNFVIPVLLGLIPSSQKENRFDKEATDIPKTDMRDNPIIGFRPRRVLKMLAFLVGLPITIFLLAWAYLSLTSKP